MDLKDIFNRFRVFRCCLMMGESPNEHQERLPDSLSVKALVRCLFKKCCLNKPRHKYVHVHPRNRYMHIWTHANALTNARTQAPIPLGWSVTLPHPLKPDLSACSAEFSNRPDFWPLPFLAVHRREDEVPKPLSSPAQKISCSSSPPTHERAHTHKQQTRTHGFPFGMPWG